MPVSPTIKAPMMIQLYRVAFAACGAYLVSFVFRSRHTGTFEGLLILAALAFCCLLGFVYSFIRARRSRWVMATVGILISAAVFIGMCLMEWSRPTAWWDWSLSVLGVVAIWFGVPITFAVMLFKERRANEYFTLFRA